MCLRRREPCASVKGCELHKKTPLFARLFLYAAGSGSGGSTIGENGGGAEARKDPVVAEVRLPIDALKGKH